MPASGFDLVSARFGQDGERLTLELRTARDWTVSQLSPRTGRSLCVLLFTDGGHTRVCAVPGDGRPLALRWSRLDAGGHPVVSRAVAGTATHPDLRTLRATFTPDAARLAEGRLRWRAASGWVDASPACPPRNTACTDLVPDGGSVPARITSTVRTGCVPGGPVERRSGPAGHRMVALTFDDGPAAITARFLDLLERFKVHGTFFVVGRSVPGHEALLRRMLRDGNTIGNHSFTHADLGGGGAGAQIAETNAAIHRATGYTPCLFRPPYGSTGPGLRAEVAAAGMRSILWDVDPADWANPGADAIAARVLAAVHPGAIVLSHDGGGPREGTLAAYERIIPALLARGYKLVSLEELLSLRPARSSPAPR